MTTERYLEVALDSALNSNDLVLAHLIAVAIERASLHQKMKSYCSESLCFCSMDFLGGNLNIIIKRTVSELTREYP